MSLSWSSKKECRSFFKSLCAQEFAQGLVQNQNQLNTVLRDFMSRQTGLWGAYRALAQEAQVEEVFQIAHITWSFPRMTPTGTLEFLQAFAFHPGPYGVLEPEEAGKVRDLSEHQGILVPGLAFNKNGSRLGKGKGFYDKTLSDYPGVKVGIAFDFQVTSIPLPIETHDVTVDVLLTESGVIECRK